MSPIKEGESAAIDINLKQQQLNVLNNELSKINSRRDSVEPDVEVGLLVPNVEVKERRISRFKVSVVTEPDLNKLETKMEEQQTTDAVVGVINEAYKNLEKVVESCYSIKPGLLFVKIISLCYCVVFFLQI